MQKRLFAFFSCLLVMLSSQAQTKNGWSPVKERDIPVISERKIQPNVYLTFHLKADEFKSWLTQAPTEETTKVKDSDFILTIPTPDGQEESFRIVAYNMMEEGLSAAYPEISNYYGISLRNAARQIRLDWTYRGFHAMIMGGDEPTYYIDPFQWDDVEHYQVYFKEDYTGPESNEFKCGVRPDPNHQDVDISRMAGDCTFRTYRLAMATTGEYSNYHGANSAAQSNLVLAEINTAMNRVNGIYERDIAVRMILIANTDNIFYYDGSTDPYTNNSGGTMLNENQNNIDMVIGSANYDIGHVFSTGGGGIAQLRSPCTGGKARGVTGLNNPINDPFYVDYVAHEMGHQFGANHTQNNSCQRNGATAMEPGSASTIMGYAGICAPNVQNNSDDYFHAISIQEMIANITTGNSSSCDTETPQGNNAPTVMVDATTHNIPNSTPFVLTANSGDADGTASHTFCWEQFDNEVAAAMPPVSTNTEGPAFRTLDPTMAPERYFPRLSDVPAGNTWEVLPSVARTMTFRVTVRDNASMEGCTAEEDVTLTVDGTAGPFDVTAPAAAASWTGNQMATITWDVANTDMAPINCNEVDIMLSTDGGVTYNTVIANNQPNTGSASVTVPNISTTTARIMVKASDNVFFDINAGNFTIMESLVSFNEGDIIITEIMNNPSEVNDDQGEYFEVYNTTDEAIDLDGWTISDNGSNSVIINSTVIVPANGYAVLGVNDNMASNGGVDVDYDYGTASDFTLANSDDEIILTAPDATEIDRVEYDGGPNFPDPTGASMNLSPGAFDFTSNNTGSNWCEATSSFGDGDLGTPGSANDVCISCSDITCPTNIEVDNDAGECGAIVNYSLTPPADCANPVLTSDPVSGSFFDVGTTTVTVSSSDDNGNTSSCTFNVTVNDTENPTVTCPDDLTVSTSPGFCTYNINPWGTLPTSDNCSSAAYVEGTAMFGGDAPAPYGLGVNTVTFTVQDEAGNTGTCSFNITVEDNEDPMITCPSNVEVDNDAGECAAVVNYDPATATDNCDMMVDITYTQNSGTSFDVGSTTVTATATDDASNTATCSFDVTVNDTEDPLAACPSNITQGNDAGECGADVLFSPTIGDNCPGVTASASPMSGSFFDVGTTTVTVTSTDVAGNTATCTFSVTVNDTENPTITCPDDVTVSTTPGFCTYNLNPWGTLPTSDNCSSAAYVEGTAVFTTSVAPYGLGENTVGFSVSDEAGNTGTCSFKITVEDNTTCGCDMPQPGDVCDDGDPETNNDMIQDDCSCMGFVCDIEITSVDVMDETCEGENDGTITINATCTTCDDILYSIDGGMTTQSSPTFTGLSPDTYQPFVIDSGDNTCDDTDMDATVNMGDPLPADPVVEVATKSLCVNPDLSPSLTNSGVKVMNDLSADERVVWVLTSAPAGSAFAANDEFTIDNCGDPFNNYGELAVAFSSKVIRIQDIENAPVGTYTFDTYIENCATGCISGTTSGFSITVNAAPSVMITADPEGDLCLGQEDVQYNAVVTSTDGGTYSYLWCAYNSGDGSGSCFNGFDNNTAQDPMRDWTSSAGAKSVGVTATSDVAGCEAEDLYSFEVVAPTMVECPDDIMATLETDPMTFDCTTDITFNHPMVEAGACDPVNLTLEITGPSGAGPAMVTPGEEYVFSVVELGEYTVTYNLSDAVGNISTCSFNITVDGLLCGWVDNGGIGDCAGENGSDYDPETETFNVTSNGCVPAFPYIGDNQAFINTQLCGDGYIEVFVDNITAKGFAGISLRESQAPGAKKVEIGTDNVARIIRAARVIDGYPAFPQELISFDKFWLKIERTGNTFRASASTDGVSYTPYLFQSIMMGECLEAGLWAYSTNPEDVVTATFNNVTVVEFGGDNLQAPVTNLAQSQTDLGAFDVSLTPNPAKEQVALNLNQLVGESATIRIFNINGHLMSNIQFDRVEQSTETINVAHLPQGAYWVQVQSASGQKTMKLIKQ